MLFTTHPPENVFQYLVAFIRVGGLNLPRILIASSYDTCCVSFLISRRKRDIA